MCHLPYNVCANNFLDFSCYKHLDNKIMWYSYKWTVDISSHCTCLCQTSASAQAVGHGDTASLLACPFAQKSVQLLSSSLGSELFACDHWHILELCLEELWTSEIPFCILSQQKCEFSPGCLLAFT